MPWEELEEIYASQFNPTTGAPAKPVRLAFGALFIKQRLGLTDKEIVEQIRGNAYMQFFPGFAGYSSKAPFDPSMMAHSRKSMAATPSVSALITFISIPRTETSALETIPGYLVSNWGDRR